MRLVTMMTEEGADHVGVLVGADQVLDLCIADRDSPEFRDMLALIDSGDEGLHKVRALSADPKGPALRPLAAMRLRAPIPCPPRMRAMSLDPKHLAQAKAGMAKLRALRGARSTVAAQAAQDAPLPAVEAGYFETPVYWFMDQYCVSGPDDHIAWPEYSDWIDYELEIAAVIGRPGRNVAKGNANEYIFGFTILNDLSARDAQLKAAATGLSITAKGKDFAGSYPMGPCIVTRDECRHDDIRAVLRVNGEEWGRGTSLGRHWDFEDGIAYASQACDLIPGEILSSATVANCCGLEVAREGRRGDCVELEVEPIGVLRTWID